MTVFLSKHLDCFTINNAATDTMSYTDSELCIQDVSFEDDVKIILEKSCTVAGCHGTNGPMKGDFTSYESVVKYVRSGDAFRKRIFESKDMPPFYSPSKTTLSSEELKIIECWIDQGLAK